MLGGKNYVVGEGRKEKEGDARIYAVVRVCRPRKEKRALRARSLLPLRSSSPRPWCRVFFPRRGEIGIRDYVINIHVTRWVPRQCSHYSISVYLPIRRSCVYLYVHRDNAGIRVPLASRTDRERENLGTISASIQCRYTSEGNQSQARHNLSLIASSSSSRSFSLPRSCAHEALNTIKTFNGN